MNRVAAFLSGSSLAIALACTSQNDRLSASDPPAFVPLGAETEAALAGDPEIRAELSSVLREYFGEFRAPRFRVLAGWAEFGFDPNRSPLEGARPASDLSGTTAEAIRLDNRRFWSSELARVEAGKADSVGPFPRMPYVDRAWRELRAQRARLAPDVFRRRTVDFFAERYPSLDEGAELFVANCARCHGPEGAGNGPMAVNLSPKPRDYRRGVFKFAAVESGSKPRRADLLRTLVHGLPGSAMPSFGRSALAELNALIDYVRYLAIRGEVEARLVAGWEISETRPREAIAGEYERVWNRWLAANDRAKTVVAPPADSDPARLALGDALFHDRRRANCVSCHGESGRGDGDSALRVDADGARHVLLHDEWRNSLLPRDLTLGVFRGGTEREDVYLRIHCGIPGTPMPAFGASLDAEGGPLLSEEEKWAVVDYVLSLSGRGPFGAGSSGTGQ